MRIALLGLGEVGRVFAEEFAHHDLIAWDTAFIDTNSPAHHNARDLGVHCATSAADAVYGADLTICAVTAAHTLSAAQAAAPGFDRLGSWFFDLNSSSPQRKICAADVIEAAGGRYVEAALMSPINPKRLGAPFLLGGPHAADFLDIAATLGMTEATVFSEELGKAAATKLCRSVIVKGLESLLGESLLAARRYGVEREVLDSLSNILPPADWDAIATYFISRSLLHGTRRAEEMVEAAATVADVGVDPWMAEAAVLRQRWAAPQGESIDADLLIMLDRILATTNNP
ncbi:MAG: hypothetical protein RJB01_192, partial [Actinomycetota bacterium]